MTDECGHVIRRPDCPDCWGVEPLAPTAEEMAQARAARWKRCAKRQRRYDRHMIAIGDGWREERDQARAEVARLRSALAEIARLQPKEEETQ